MEWILLAYGRRRGAKFHAHLTFHPVLPGRHDQTRRTHRQNNRSSLFMNLLDEKLARRLVAKRTRTCHAFCDMKSTMPDFRFDGLPPVLTGLSAETVAHVKGSSRKPYIKWPCPRILSSSKPPAPPSSVFPSWSWIRVTLSYAQAMGRRRSSTSTLTFLSYHVLPSTLLHRACLTHVRLGKHRVS